MTRKRYVKLLMACGFPRNDCREAAQAVRVTECSYEHNCSVHGCRIMRVAAERLEQLTSAVGRQEVMVYRDGG